MNDGFPTSGRLGGVDYGTVRIGVAISDIGQTISSPHVNYDRQNETQDARFFQKLAVAEELAGWVIGLPIHLHGDESQKSVEARAFGTWLQEVSSLPIVFFDERFSSAFAETALNQAGLTSKQRKKRRDMLAAQIILSGYLQSTRQQQSNQPLSDEDHS